MNEIADKIEIRAVQHVEDFLAAKALILEYVNWLGMDLSFQDFDKEVTTLQETYSHPDGKLFMALRNNGPVGVAGIKRFNDKECEVKRMFVQPGNRGLGIGKLLLTQCIEMAKKLNYDTIKLDTADFMKSAIKLYIDAGFIEIPAYRHNPHEEARYFQLNLGKALAD